MNVLNRKYICEYQYNPAHKIIRYLGLPMHLRKPNKLSMAIGYEPPKTLIAKIPEPPEPNPNVYYMDLGEKIYVDCEVNSSGFVTII